MSLFKYLCSCIRFHLSIIIAMLVILTIFILYFHGVCNAITFGDMANNLKPQAGPILNFGLKISLVFGIILVVFGLIKISDQSKQQGIKGPLVIFLVGICLMSIGAVASIGSSTFFGKDKTDMITEQLD